MYTPGDIAVVIKESLSSANSRLCIFDAKRVGRRRIQCNGYAKSREKKTLGLLGSFGAATGNFYAPKERLLR